MKKKVNLMPIILILILFAIIVHNVSFQDILSLPNDFYANYEEIEQSNRESRFGKFVSTEFVNKDVDTGTTNTETGEVVFKLFGIIPIKKVTVKILPEKDVYVGGCPIGLNVSTDGVVVVSDSFINNHSGEVVKNKWIKTGDIIQCFDGEEIKNINDLQNKLKSTEKDDVIITILRNGKSFEIKTSLLKNSDDKYQLGLWVRDDLSGIGTLTFVMPNTGKFGALGHSIANENEFTVPIANGEIFGCNLVNIEKGEKDKPGQLQCVFVERNRKGIIEKNTNVGIFGSIEDSEGLVDTNRCMKLGGRLSVKPGKATIISSVSGISEDYEIEIIKVNSQKNSSDKSFVFRVKDERLIDLTGGIVQGMSGSPIVQNGKIIGAVTHVFISDATKGFGVYTDWMLENL